VEKFAQKWTEIVDKRFMYIPNFYLQFIGFSVCTLLRGMFGSGHVSGKVEE
jgi:hypothetical protein